jgi:hypothetical protein
LIIELAASNISDVAMFLKIGSRLEEMSIQRTPKRAESAIEKS